MYCKEFKKLPGGGLSCFASATLLTQWGPQTGSDVSIEKWESQAGNDVFLLTKRDKISKQTTELILAKRRNRQPTRAYVISKFAQLESSTSRELSRQSGGGRRMQISERQECTQELSYMFANADTSVIR